MRSWPCSSGASAVEFTGKKKHQPRHPRALSKPRRYYQKLHCYPPWGLQIGLNRRAEKGYSRLYLVAGSALRQRRQSFSHDVQEDGTTSTYRTVPEAAAASGTMAVPGVWPCSRDSWPPRLNTGACWHPDAKRPAARVGRGIFLALARTGVLQADRDMMDATNPGPETDKAVSNSFPKPHIEPRLVQPRRMQSLQTTHKKEEQDNRTASGSFGQGREQLRGTKQIFQIVVLSMGP